MSQQSHTLNHHLTASMEWQYPRLLWALPQCRHSFFILLCPSHLSPKMPQMVWWPMNTEIFILNALASCSWDCYLCLLYNLHQRDIWKIWLSLQLHLHILELMTALRWGLIFLMPILQAISPCWQTHIHADQLDSSWAPLRMAQFWPQTVALVLLASTTATLHNLMPACLA